MIGHRGGSKMELENTLESFKEGMKQGCDILELDICVTKDKHLVVCHD